MKCWTNNSASALVIEIVTVIGIIIPGFIVEKLVRNAGGNAACEATNGLHVRIY
jgi:hypothetical protein